MDKKDLLDYFLQRGLEISTNIEEFEKNLERKGSKRYYDIFNRLHKVKKNLTDKHLHDFYRYDIRIRRFLYKYITPIEVYYRAQVANKNFENSRRIERLTFGQLIEEYYKNNQILSDIKDLRNYVMHFRMIQLFDDDKICSLINKLFIEIKDHGYSNKFINDMILLDEDLNLIYKYYLNEKGVISYGMGTKNAGKRENEAS